MKDVVISIHQEEDGGRESIQVQVAASSGDKAREAIRQVRELFPDHLMECADVERFKPDERDFWTFNMTPSVEWF